MSACPALEGQLADGRLRLAARPVRQPPAPIVEERQEEHHRPRPRYADAALLPAAAFYTTARVSGQKITITGSAVLHKKKTVAAALRLARYIEVAIHGADWR